MKSLRKSIEWTLKYFSFFDFPLTAFEVWKWQRGTEYSYVEVLDELKTCTWSKSGIFFTSNSETKFRELDEMVLMRHGRYRDAIAKYRRVRWYLYYLARLPWIEGIAFCNNLPFHNTKEGSDIDLFLLTKPGTLWKTRLFAVAPLRLLKLRPGEAQQHPIDVSFLIATDAMSLEHLQFADDPYLAMWVTALSPVFERRTGVFTAFWEQNAWAVKQFPQAQPGQRAAFWRSHQRWSFPLFFSERWARDLQKKMLPKSLTSPSAESSIVMNEAMLKFHQNDRRQEIATFLCE